MATVTQLGSEIVPSLIWPGGPGSLDREPPTIEPDKHYEVVDGQIVEETPLGAYEAGLAGLLMLSIGNHAMSNGLGRVVPEMLFALRPSPRLRRRPDIAFVSQERWAIGRPIPREAAWNVIPDLAVEITSPTDLIDDLMDKLDEYFAAGVRLVWVVYPKHRRIYTYDSATSVRILQAGGELDGGAVLPGFRLLLSSLFETAEDEPTPPA